MRKTTSVITVSALCVLVFCGCQSTQVKEKGCSEEIVVLCPKIFASVIKEIKRAFEKANPPYRIKLDVYLLRPMLEDILKGKEGDIFLSIGDVELSHLYEKNLVKKETEKAFAKTSLVALAVPGNPLEITAFKDIGSPNIKKISIPNPVFNSAGAAFIEAAKKIGIYEGIKGRLHFAPGPNSATKYMDEGKAEVSVTYTKCYYGHAKKNALIEFIPTALHRPIVCKAVVFESSKRTEIAEKFIEFLLTLENQKRFKNAYFKGIK